MRNGCVTDMFLNALYNLGVTSVMQPQISTDTLYMAYVIRTLHDCPSQMNENLLISNSKLTSDSDLIWWR